MILSRGVCIFTTHTHDSSRWRSHEKCKQKDFKKDTVQKLSEREQRRSLPNGYSMPGFDTAAISNRLDSAFQGDGTAINRPVFISIPAVALDGMP